jgi:thymidylate synthase ThyX
MEFEDLKHVRRKLTGNGFVLVLDTGALITPEANAMIQALHSRSIGGIDAHLLKLAQKGAKQFMDTYYVGYGDKSIGDNGTATIFVEGMSMLVAKAIQDSMLYNGQEASTRYIDFSKQAFANPAGSARGSKSLESLRSFHLEGLEEMKNELANRHPRQNEEDEKVWRKAINARAFDIMRGTLPASAATNLAWHTTLRHAADHLLRLRNHTLPEVREAAKAMHEALDEMFPSSFKQKLYEATEEYTRSWMELQYYYLRTDGPEKATLEHFGLDRTLLNEYRSVLANRPKKTEPPKFLGECGTMRFSFQLDFGSYRDIQRHRALIQRMPLLTTELGFHPWYLEQMPPALRSKTESFLAQYSKEIDSLGLTDLETQYYVPMGYKVSCRISGDLPSLIWLVELRSGISVHPTLRIVAQDIGALMLKELKDYDLTLHLDESEDRFNYKRSVQDIVEKPAIAI